MNTFRDMDMQTKGIFTEAEFVMPEASTICNRVPNQSWKMTCIYYILISIEKEGFTLILNT
jgi:hypothetical protein